MAVKTSHIFTILISTFCALEAHAQFILEKVVHSEDQPAESAQWVEDQDAVSTINEDEIESQAAASVDDVLRMAPGATTARGPRNSGESIQIRGLDASKVFIMVDGARQNFRGGHSSMIPVDIENLKAVEIYESSSDFSKGNSLGGGIQFVTKDPEDYLRKGKDLGGQFKYQNNSANSENIYNAKNVFRKKEFSGLISLSAQNAGNIQLNDGETLENSSYDDFIGFLKLKRKAWTFSHESFRREDNNPLDPTLNPPSSIKSLLADSLMRKDTSIIKYEKNNLFVNAYYNRFFTEKTERENEVTEKRSINTLGASFKKKVEDIRFGAEAYQDRLDSDEEGSELTSFPEAESLNASAYIENDFHFGQLDVTPGLRLNHYSLKDLNDEFASKSAQALSKKLKIKYSFDKETYVYTSYSEGFNSPRVDEVYPSGLHSPGDDFIVRDNYFIPNDDLKHETSANKEVGFSGRKYLFDYLGSLSFKASIYENKVKDYIRIERIDRSIFDDENGTSQFVNVPKATLYGGEAEIGLNYDIFEWKLAYTQVRGKNETDNLYLEDLPADQYTYSFNVYLDRFGAQIGYLGIQAQEQNRTNPQTLQRTEKTPGYFIHNVYGKKDIGDNFEIGLRIDNLGNKEYRRHGAFLNESAEDYKLSFKYKVNTL